MNIGQASLQSGVSAKMIRYYEKVGLLPPAHRTEAGYRVYVAKDIHVLRFVRRARDFGFPVNEIGALLELWSDTSRKSADVKRLAQQHVADLRVRIEALQQMAATLETLIACCAGDDRPDCPIISGLQDDANPPAQDRQTPHVR